MSIPTSPGGLSPRSANITANQQDKQVSYYKEDTKNTSCHNASDSQPKPEPLDDTRHRVDADGDSTRPIPPRLVSGWVEYPCERERPQFAGIPHEVRWDLLYTLRKAKEGAS